MTTPKQTTYAVKCECCGRIAVCNIVRGAALICPTCPQ